MADIDFITHHDSLSLISEAYRAIRTNLQFTGADKAIKIISFTSALPGEGKSTTIANLAIALGQDEKRVLLIDGDLRRPVMHRRFGVANRGLSNCFADNLALSDVIQHEVYPNLDLVTSGPVPPNPSELLSSTKMEKLLAGVQSSYDYILIDTPPVLVVTDAAVIGSKADGTVLVIGSGDVSPEDAQAAKSLLEKAHANIIGAVLNKVPQKGRRHYYYYYYDKEHAKGE